VRIHGHVAEHDEILRAVDGFLPGRLEGRAREKSLAGGNVDEADVIEGGMAFGFHGNRGVRSTLPRLVAGIGLVDHVDFATAADHLAVRVALLGGFDGGNDFHKR
jgi:hypothetical protein